MWLFRSGIVVVLYVAITIYTGARLLNFVKYFVPSFRAFIFWPLYLLLCFSYILLFFLRVDNIQFLRNPAMLSLPFIAYFFMGLLLLDILRLVLRLAHVIPASPFYLAMGAGIALVFALLSIVYGYYHARDIATTHYDITINKEAGESESRLRVAVVSDLHLGATVDRKWLTNIVNAINKSKPDLICIGGDIIDNDIGLIQDLDGVEAELRRLDAPLGVFACQGNHDVDRLSLRGGATTDRLQEFLKKADIDYLLDEVKLVSGFYLISRRDARPIGLNQARKTASELTAGLDNSKPFIFLDHQPVDFPREEEAGADLIFSGHTHNGQFFPGNIATAYIYRKAGAVSYGYWRGRTAQGIVSSGAGVWGPSIRIGTKSEVAVIDITFAAGN